MSKTGYVSDLEGPIVKNDNAAEITKEFIPDGAKLFDKISAADDIWSELRKPKEFSGKYPAGYTLALIVPFLRVYGVTQKMAREFSKESLVVVPGVQETIKNIRKFMPVNIISTSYSFFLEAWAELFNFPMENIFCTTIDFDQYYFSKINRRELRDYAEEILDMPDIKIGDAKKFSDLVSEIQEAVSRMEEIFFDEMTYMPGFQDIIKEIKPVGSHQKAEALLEISKKSGIPMNQMMYVGDSITDVEAFKTIKRGGGLAVSFNGNQFAIKEADIAIIAKDTILTEIVASEFRAEGRERAFTLAFVWDNNNSNLKSLYLQQFPQAANSGTLRPVFTDNSRKKFVEETIKLSEEMREKVRGEVGSLG